MTPTLEAGTKTGAPRPDGRPHELTLHPDGFRLDGRPFQIRSGEMHPVRIPRREWSHRIAMAKAMGLNTISIYLMWNTLEQKPGVFDLHTDRRDFAEFIRLCQRAGMWVFLRPGPYICGEWDFGGLPAYLLFDDTIALRSRDPRYLSACERYIATVAPSLVPLLSQNGGSVLLTQVENEYASFGGDLEYMRWVRNAWQRHGMIGPFSIADGLAQLREKRTFLSDCAIGLDGDLSTAGARTLYPATPAWISEAYPGWLSHWGEKNMAKVEFTEDFRKILDARLSFNLYVVHGGTNFGFGAGANAHGDGTHFQPVVTSYDYDAPIDEAGRATPKFHILRTLLSQTADEMVPTIPHAPVMIDFAPVVAECIGGMEDLLPPAVLIDEPISLERGLRQSCGMALYRTTLPAGTGGVLRLPPVHDYARVFLDNFEIGTLSRLEPQSPQIEIQPAARARRLDIWIDSFGHIGFGHALGDRKGLEGPVMIDRQPLRGWQFFGLPLDEHFIAQCARQPASDSAYKFLFRGHVELHKQGGTYINLSAWKKGYCWINGNLLGRYWNLGPQSRLYCPAEWLRDGRNEILILDYHQTESAPVSGHFTMGH